MCVGTWPTWRTGYGGVLHTFSGTTSAYYRDTMAEIVAHLTKRASRGSQSMGARPYVRR